MNYQEISAQELDIFLERAGKQNFRPALFLQSSKWSQVLRADGAVFKHFGFFRAGKKELAAIMTVVYQGYLRFFNYDYSPGGPVLINNLTSLELKALAESLLKWAQTEKLLFWRFESSQALVEALSQEGRVRKALNLQPAQTIVLDLNNTPEKLLANLSQKTRYNIRLAAKKGVTIREGSSADWPAAWKIMEATATRDRFFLHSREHYENMLRQKDLVRFFVAEKDQEILALGLFAFFGSTVTYLHGASSNSQRELMAPYAIQWFAIVRAQADGYRFYDFYGIDEKKWPGVTRFKRSFGGQEQLSAGTYDLVIQALKYRLYAGLRLVRRLLR